MEGGEGPREGWYDDPHDPTGLRWWDGSAWSEHTHPKQAPTQPGPDPERTAAAQPAQSVPTPEQARAMADALMPTPVPGSTAEPSAPYGRLPWVLGIAGLVLVLGLVILLAVGGGDGDDVDATAADEDAKVAVRAAQTAIETWAVDHGGSYAGVTAQDLAAMDSSLAGLEMTVDGQAGVYTVSVKSESGTEFHLARSADGMTGYSCSHPGTGGCPPTGNWAETP